MKIIHNTAEGYIHSYRFLCVRYYHKHIHGIGIDIAGREDVEPKIY